MSHDHGHCESSPGSFDECRLSAGWRPTLRPSQPTWAVSPPINGCYHPHPPSPFVIITQPESWYSFHRPTEGGRLSRPRHYSKGAQPVPKAVHRSGCRDKHNYPWTLIRQSIIPSLNHCNLPRHVGVNNLPKVVTRQRRGRELNAQPASCKSNAFATRLPNLRCRSEMCCTRLAENTWRKSRQKSPSGPVFLRNLTVSGWAAADIGWRQLNWR